MISDVVACAVLIGLIALIAGALVQMLATGRATNERIAELADSIFGKGDWKKYIYPGPSGRLTRTSGGRSGAMGKVRGSPVYFWIGLESIGARVVCPTQSKWQVSLDATLTNIPITVEGYVKSMQLSEGFISLRSIPTDPSFKWGMFDFESNIKGLILEMAVPGPQQRLLEIGVPPSAPTSAFLRVLQIELDHLFKIAESLC